MSDEVSKNTGSKIRLQNPRRIIGDNVNDPKHDTSRTFGNKEIKYLKDKKKRH